MFSHEEKILKSLKNFKLSSEEKNTSRLKLLSFMKLKPVRRWVFSRQEYRSNVFVSILNLAKKPMPIVISIVLLLTAGTSIAAEKALPGQVLYPIKVAINEEVIAFASFDSEAKAEWEIRRTERRLEEAEELASKGRFSAEVSQRIEANFEEHAERVRARIAEFEAKDVQVSTDLSSKFEASLRAHENILERFATTTSDQVETSVKIQQLKAQVKARADSEARARLKFQGEVNLPVLPPARDDEPIVCIQVITKARNPQTGEVKEFPTPCDVPEGWKLIQEDILELDGSVKGKLRARIEAEL